MDISLMNVFIKFQTNETVTDRYGNHKNEWTDYYSCHATVSGEGGDERSIAANTKYDADIAFTVRWCRALEHADPTNMRIIFDDEIYDIRFIDHMNYKRECLKFRCKKVSR